MLVCGVVWLGVCICVEETCMPPRANKEVASVGKLKGPTSLHDTQASARLELRPPELKGKSLLGKGKAWGKGVKGELMWRRKAIVLCKGRRKG